MTQSQSKLTIMVSLYNSGEWIENRIKNLLQSSHKNAEIWCVNADSPDQRDHDIPQQYPVKYVRLPKRITVYETWNYIIENSSSEFITNANTDDLIHPHGYTSLIETLEHLGPDYGFAYPNWMTTCTPNQEWSKIEGFDKAGRPGHYAGDIETAGVGHFPLWRRSLHTSVGLFDTNYRALADADWWARCHHVAKTKFHWVDEFLGCYLWKNGDNLWHKEINSSEWERYHNNMNSYKKGIIPCLTTPESE